jgi:hypothetical protein
MNTFISILVGFAGAIALYGIWRLKSGRAGGRNGARQTSVHSGIEQLKAIGQLSVYKVLTKEIVTEIDHSWGEIGRKYLSWILSVKKMAMIFEFEIDFRFDLRSPDFKIVETGKGYYLLRMPPCLHETSIRDIQFYDEQKSKLIPWLLPDLLNTLFGNGFSEQDKNRLKDAARRAAETQALALIGNIGSDVEQSAVQTLRSLARAFGAENVEFEFPCEGRSVATDNDSQ